MKSYYTGGTAKTRVAEGIDFYTKCIGTFSSVVEEYSGSLRSALTYAGHIKLENFISGVKFFHATSNYLTESNHREGQ